MKSSYPQLFFIDEEHLWTDDTREQIWRTRERIDLGEPCCLRHFKLGGRSACRADRRMVEDCGA